MNIDFGIIVAELNERLDQELAANKTLRTAKDDVELQLRTALQSNQDSEDVQVRVLLCSIHNALQSIVFSCFVPAGRKHFAETSPRKHR